ncbi:MAG: hypothetical protein QNM02_11845 [Acidimicrobiia bacterium]|nr:hypothetical protein [Acidimicrobiia bacterium]
MSSDDRNTLRALRRTRTQHRLGDVEWYDVAYRVYLFGLVGLTIVVVGSDAIRELIPDDVSTAEILARGPATIGMVAAVACAVGLRGGSDGGPISIEPADVRHLLLAPIPRRMVMTKPVLQRLRSVVFALALGAAVLGQLVARELDGSRAAWAASCALFGAIVGALYVSMAMFAHVLRMPRWLAGLLGAIVVVWQTAAVWAVWNDGSERIAESGPANLLGGIALWGIRQRPADFIAAAIVVCVTALAVALCGGLRLEPLARRGDLVTQLRFAATVQDLRTVVVLRRQLRAETLRPTPWGRRQTTRMPPGELIPGTAEPARRGDTPPQAVVVWRRGLRSLRRLPAARLIRITLLAAVGGVSAALTVSASPLWSLLLLAAVFLVGMESLEPLSQEVDRPDQTDGLPVDRGWMYLHHLVASAVVLGVAGIVGAVAATLVEPDGAAVAFALALPVTLLGATGAVVTTVLDASAPMAVASTTLTGAPRGEQSPFALPEFAGASMAFRTLTPVIVSASATVPVLLLRLDATPATVIRSTVGAALFIAGLLVWVRRRDRWSLAIRGFLAEGRAAA